MTKVQFKRGLKAQMPTSATRDTLLFATDVNEIYMGTGTSISKMGDVYSGYANLVDLQAKSPVGIIGKLYYTDDVKLYAFTGGTYQLVAGSSTITSFEADKVTFDKTTTTLISENVQDVIVELDGKVEINKADTTTLKGKVTTLETDNTKNKADITDLQTKQGQVKTSSTDTLGYLSDKADGVTVVVENDKLVVKSVEGLTIATSQLNLLDGATSNIQTQINDVIATISASSSGLSFGGTVTTKADLDALSTIINGTLYVVLADELQEDGRTMYIYSEDTSSFIFVGKFEFAEKFIELQDTPNAYEDGKFVKSTTNGLIFTEVSYDDLTNKPTSTIVAIDDSVAKSHEHANVDTLNKFGEDVDGKPTFNNQPIGGELVWEEWNL